MRRTCTTQATGERGLLHAGPGQAGRFAAGEADGALGLTLNSRLWRWRSRSSDADALARRRHGRAMFDGFHNGYDTRATGVPPYAPRGTSQHLTQCILAPAPSLLQCKNMNIPQPRPTALRATEEPGSRPSDTHPSADAFLHSVTLCRSQGRPQASGPCPPHRRTPRPLRAQKTASTRRLAAVAALHGHGRGGRPGTRQVRARPDYVCLLGGQFTRRWWPVSGCWP